MDNRKKYLSDLIEEKQFEEHNLIIFSNNSNGKTMYAESRFLNSEFYPLSINGIQKFFKTYTKKSGDKRNTDPNNNTYDYDEEWLKLEKNPKYIELKINSEQIKKINDFLKILNVKINNETNDQDIDLLDIEIKIEKNRKKWKMNSDDIPLSASELSLIKLVILSCIILFNNFNLIIDDPLESTSLTNEKFFLNIIKDIILYFEKQKIQILTHRISIFRNLFFMKKDLKKFKFLFMTDNFIFETNQNELEKVIYSHKRVSIEQIIKISKKNEFENILKIAKEKYNELSRKTKNQIKCDDLIVEKPNTLKDYVNLKLDILYELRESIIRDLKGKDKITEDNEDTNHTLKKLGFLKKDIFIKNSNKNDKEYCLFFLNQSLHYDENWNYIIEFSIQFVIIFLEKHIDKRKCLYFNKEIKKIKNKLFN